MGARPGAGTESDLPPSASLRSDYVVVLATKARDPDLYERLERQGFVLREVWAPDPEREPKVIFRPPLRSDRIMWSCSRRRPATLIYTSGWNVKDSYSARYGRPTRSGNRK